MNTLRRILSKAVAITFAATVIFLPTLKLSATDPIVSETRIRFPEEVRCAHDVERLLTSTRTINSVVLGFNTSSLFDPSGVEHIQGIARYEHEAQQYLFVSQSRRGRKAGILATVKMGSRMGESWGSNRTLSHIGRSFVYKGPPDLDRVIAIKSDDGFAYYSHPGGLAILGDILAVGMEAPHDESVHPKGRVDLYRIESPTSLVPLTSIANSGQMAASVALTRLSSGQYLLAVPDNSPKNIRFYRSAENRALDANTRFEQIAVFSEADLKPGDSHYFQNLDFVTDCGSGNLYMVLSFQDHDAWGFWQKDRLARYEIMNPGGMPSLRHLGRQRVNCSPTFAANLCDFDAAFGAYVTNSGKLLYYASEPKNSGWNGSVNLAEFAPE